MGAGIVDVHIVDPHVAEPEPGTSPVSDLLVAGSTTLMAWCEVRHHFGDQSIDTTSTRVSLAKRDTLVLVARQPGQTQAGFDSVAGSTSYFGSWYDQRPSLVKERIFLGFRLKVPPPPP